MPTRRQKKYQHQKKRSTPIRQMRTHFAPKRPETPQASPWLKVLDDMLNEADPEQESINGIPVAELIYLREKIRRAPKIPAMDTSGKLQELHPCPLPGQPSQPWAMSKRQVKIGPKGQISFPSPQIKRPKIWGEQPGSQQSKRGQQGKNGQPQPGSGIGSHPGKKAGDVIGKRPAKGSSPGKGDEAGEGAGDYPKELWSPPVPRSEVAKLLQQEWGLPFLEPRGQGNMNQLQEFWDQTTTTPPNLIEKKPTLKNAIQRSYAKAWYDKPMTLAERIRNGMHPGSPAILVRDIIIQGNTLVGSKTLDKAMESFTGKDLTFEDLSQILTTLDQKYQASGYPTSKAIIPPQSLDSGRLLIDVREVRDSFSQKDIQVHAKDNVRIATRVAPKPVAKTAIIYVMDVSGSVSNDMKEMARVQNYFLDTHLMHQYGLVAAQLSNEKTMTENTSGKAWNDALLCIRMARKKPRRKNSTPPASLAEPKFHRALN